MYFWLVLLGSAAWISGRHACIALQAPEIMLFHHFLDCGLVASISAAFTHVFVSHNVIARAHTHDGRICFLRKSVHSRCAMRAGMQIFESNVECMSECLQLVRSWFLGQLSVNVSRSIDVQKCFERP